MNIKIVGRGFGVQKRAMEGPEMVQEQPSDLLDVGIDEGKVQEVSLLNKKMDFEMWMWH